VCDDLGKRSLQSTRPQGGFFSYGRIFAIRAHYGDSVQIVVRFMRNKKA